MSSHNAVFPVECQVMIDKTLSEKKREISLNLHFPLEAESTSTVANIGCAGEFWG